MTIQKPELDRRLFMGLTAAAAAATVLPAAAIEMVLTVLPAPSPAHGDVFGLLRGTWKKIGVEAEVKTTHHCIESIDPLGQRHLHHGQIDTDIVMLIEDGIDNIMRAVDSVSIKIFEGDTWFTNGFAMPVAMNGRTLHFVADGRLSEWHLREPT